MAASDSVSAIDVDPLALRVRGGSAPRAAAASRRGAIARAHALVPSPRRSRDSSSLDSASTTKVMKNSTRPR